MLKFSYTIIFSMIALMFSAVCFAQGTPLPEIPDVDAFAAIAYLFENWKTLSPLAISISLVMITMQFVKKLISDENKYKGLIVVLLSLLYGFGTAVVSGMSYLGAAVLILLTNGGAVYLYEAIKSFLKGGSAFLASLDK